MRVSVLKPWPRLNITYAFLMVLTIPEIAIVVLNKLLDENQVYI